MKKIFGVLMLLALSFVACEQVGEDVKPSNIKLFVENVEAAAEGETVRFVYSIQTPTEGTTLEVKCDAEWVTDIAVYASFVDVTVAKNDSGAERSAVLQCKYGKESVDLTLVQAAWNEPLAITISKVEATAVVFSVTANSEDTTWIGQVVGKEWFDSYSEEDIFLEDLSYYRNMANDEGKTLEEYLTTILSKGSHSNIRMNGLDIGRPLG